MVFNATLVRLAMSFAQPARLFEELVQGRGQPLLLNYLGTGGNPNAIVNRSTLLQTAVWGNNVDGVKILLAAKGIDVNSTVNNHDRTAFVHACGRPDREEIVMLMLRDPRVDVTLHRGSPSPFSLLVSGCQKESISLWLELGKPLVKSDVQRSLKQLKLTQFPEEWPNSRQMSANRDSIVRKLEKHLEQ